MHVMCRSIPWVSCTSTGSEHQLLTLQWISKCGHMYLWWSILLRMVQPSTNLTNHSSQARGFALALFLAGQRQ